MTVPPDGQAVRPSRHLLLTAALPALMLLVVLTASELLLRALGYGHEVQYSYLPELGWVHRPGQHALTLGEVVQIDSSGFRGPEISKVKPPNVYRILLLGDSFTFGYGVAEPNTYGRVLAAALPGGGPQCARTEVINGGVNGYNTRQEAEYLRRIGVAYDPDLVIIGFTPNDLIDQRETRSQLWPGLKSVIARSAVYQFFAPRLHALAFRTERGAYERTMTGITQTADSAAVRQWSEVRAALLDAQAVGAQHRFQMLVAVFPTDLEVASLHEGWLRPAFAELSATSGVPTVDLLPAFRAAAAREMLFLDEPTHHPNAKGHAITGHVIAQRLLVDQVVPRCLADPFLLGGVR